MIRVFCDMCKKEVSDSPHDISLRMPLWLPQPIPHDFKFIAKGEWPTKPVANHVCLSCAHAIVKAIDRAVEKCRHELAQGSETFDEKKGGEEMSNKSSLGYFNVPPSTDPLEWDERVYEIAKILASASIGISDAGRLTYAGNMPEIAKDIVKQTFGERPENQNQVEKSEETKDE